MSKWDDAPQGIIINFSFIFFCSFIFFAVFLSQSYFVNFPRIQQQNVGPKKYENKNVAGLSCIYCVPFLLCFFFNNAKLFYKSIKTFHGISLWAKLFWKLILLTSLFILSFFFLFLSLVFFWAMKEIWYDVSF